MRLITLMPAASLVEDWSWFYSQRHDGFLLEWNVVHFWRKLTFALFKSQALRND